VARVGRGQGSPDGREQQGRVDASIAGSPLPAPSGTEAVQGTAYDFRSPRRLGELAIDYAFTDLERDSGGRAWVRLTGDDEHTAELWVDESYPLVELYTASERLEQIGQGLS